MKLLAVMAKQDSIKIPEKVLDICKIYSQINFNELKMVIVDEVTL